MTPERIQFLRATIGSEVVAAVEAEWDEMLDEIERLRGEVALLESFHIKQTDRLIDEHEAELERLRQLVRDAHAWPLGQTVELHAWTDCSCGHDLGPERGYDEMSLMHAAHIEDLLNGSANQ